MFNRYVRVSKFAVVKTASATALSRTCRSWAPSTASEDS
jgi:hypothetical protein